MTELDKTFFELIRVSLGNAICLSHSPSADEWGKLYAMAKKQSLVGICFAGVRKLQSQYQAPPEKLYLQWMGMAAIIQQRNEIVIKQCVELQERLAADGFRSCILKGQGVAQLYDEPLRMLRQSGDIDVWIDASKDAVMDYAMGIDKNSEFNDKHVHLALFNDTIVEAHWMVMRWVNPFRNKILNCYFESEREHIFENKGIEGFCVPTLEFQLIHQLLHLYAHYKQDGIGFRQVLDVYFTQYACCGRNDISDKVVGMFQSLGLYDVLSGVQWILQQLELPSDCLLCSPDEIKGRNILAEIEDGGNFGRFKAENSTVDESWLHRFYRKYKRVLKTRRLDPLAVITMIPDRICVEIWFRRMKYKYRGSIL